MRAFADTAQRFGYREIRLPVFEQTDLFARGIGDATDYRVRMEAVNYALNLDDGVHSSRLGQADIILLNLNRPHLLPQHNIYENIVYGATEPDATVTCQGRPVQLRPDGTFTLRFALPDGQQVIPCAARSADGIDTITITPTNTVRP